MAKPVAICPGGQIAICPGPKIAICDTLPVTCIVCDPDCTPQNATLTADFNGIVNCAFHDCFQILFSPPISAAHWFKFAEVNVNINSLFVLDRITDCCWGWTSAMGDIRYEAYSDAGCNNRDATEDVDLRLGVSVNITKDAAVNGGEPVADIVMMFDGEVDLDPIENRKARLVFVGWQVDLGAGDCETTGINGIANAKQNCNNNGLPNPPEGFPDPGFYQASHCALPGRTGFVGCNSCITPGYTQTYFQGGTCDLGALTC